MDAGGALQLGEEGGGRVGDGARQGGVPRVLGPEVGGGDDQGGAVGCLEQ
ncbi:hypothetical protein ACFQ0M_38800 [Kitasatospora aburaviensis]